MDKMFIRALQIAREMAMITMAMILLVILH